VQERSTKNKSKREREGIESSSKALSRSHTQISLNGFEGASSRSECGWMEWMNKLGFGNESGGTKVGSSKGVKGYM
jgi:hypothetical protein